MTFPYPINTQIPATNNDPADDQPLMQQNYANIDAYLSVDHIAPGTNPGAGFHKQISYFDNNVQPVQTGQNSVAYTVLGLADPAHNQNVWTNAIGTFPLSAIRAFGRVIYTNPSGTPVYTLGNKYNVVSVAGVGTSKINFDVTLTTGCVFGQDVVIIPFVNQVSSTITFGFTNPTISFHVSNTASSFPSQYVVHFVVLQF